MDKKVLSTKGKELRSIELDDSVFGREVSEGAIYHAVRNELANMRVGTASTLTRSEGAAGASRGGRRAPEGLEPVRTRARSVSVAVWHLGPDLVTIRTGCRRR